MEFSIDLFILTLYVYVHYNDYMIVKIGKQEEEKCLTYNLMKKMDSGEDKYN